MMGDRDAARRTGRICVACAVASTLALAQQTAWTAEPQKDESIERVIVTAQRKEEALIDVPIAVSAFDSTQLERRQIDQATDLQLNIPNVQYTKTNFTSSNFQIRGIGVSSVGASSDSGVEIHFNAMPIKAPRLFETEYFDIERVEVLRGPQGTLFGKNSLGGAIRVVSKKPSGTRGGSIEATYGDFDRLEFKGSYDLPLIEDRLFMRVTGVSKHRDGYQDVLDFTCQMIANGTPELAGIGDGLGADGPDADTLPDPVPVGSPEDNAFSFPQYVPAGQGCKLGERGAERLAAGRLMLRFVGNERFEASIAADYTDDEQTPPPSYLVYPQIPLAPGSITTYNANAIYRTYGIRTDIDDRFVTGNPYATYGTFGDPFTGRFLPAVVKFEGWGVQGTIDYDLTDRTHARLITAYREYDGQTVRDDDETPFPINNIFYVIGHEQFSAELQLTGSLIDDRLEWTLGAFYYTADQVQAGEVQLGDLAFLNIVPHFQQNDVFDTENTSAFAHAVFHVTDRLSLTAGLRYTDESKSYGFDHGVFLRIDEPAKAGLSRVDWKAGVDYRFNDAMMVYGQVSTGFRSPGFQPRPFTPIQLLPFDGEELTAYELGFKGDLFDRRLRLNTAAFYSDYSKRFVGGAGARQCSAPTEPSDPVFDPICPPGTFFEGTTGISWPLQVVAPAEVYGFEAELTYRPIDRLTLNATAGYIRFEGEIDDPTQQGYRHPDALVQPEWNASGGIQYAIPLGSAGMLTPRLDWFYQSKMTFGAVTRAPLPEETIPGYSVFNGRVTFEPQEGDWSVAFSVTNLTDKFYYYNLFGNGPTFGGGQKGTPSRPREWAITFQRRF